ncbi:MAG: 2-amino-4-hydroxy-6-hydroxymethyldihydropteridine diphosphokinase [Planctomycetia bacterium]|jgi:2-amino-4-hydroxy-6-hydroxymethyldihydropteridine diphosphokinase
MKCLVALGSNLEERQTLLNHALASLDQAAGMHLLCASAFYETKPAGGPDRQPNFLNSAALFETTLDPHALLRLLHDTENQLGRVRTEMWGPRTIDLDLLLYENEVIDSPELTLPHPRMGWRRFVLEPAAEIAPEMCHPVIGWTIRQLWEHLNQTPRYVALAGGIGAGKTSLLSNLNQRKAVNRILEAIDPALLGGFYADPASHAKRVELEFLRQRTEQLEPQRLADGPNCWSVSDFWFDQSAAFARVWLDPDEYGPFFEQWQAARAKVARPRLVVFLDPPLEQLIQQVVDRGRPFEQTIDPARLAQIHHSIRDELQKPDVGPVLRLSGRDAENDLDELTAALEAMEE